MEEQKVLYQSHPSMFRNEPLWFIVYALATVAGPVFHLIQVLREAMRDEIRSPEEAGLVALGYVATCFGAFLFAGWWIRCIGTTLTVTAEQVGLRRGILSRHTNNVMLTDVRNVQVRQSFLQRIMKVGHISVASAGHAGMEIEVSGMPHPEVVARLIDEGRAQHRRKAPAGE